MLASFNLGQRIDTLDYVLSREEESFDVFGDFVGEKTADKLRMVLIKAHQAGKKARVFMRSDKPYLYEDKDILLLKELGEICKKSNCELKLKIGSYDGVDVEDMLIAKEQIDNICNKVNNEVIKDIKGNIRKLTIAEKFMTLYSFASNKIYKMDVKEGEEWHNKPSDSSWVGLLTTEYAVCAGYASLLECLCDRAFNKEEKKVLCIQQYMESSDSGHANNLVYIKDEHYGLDGFYYCDSCWDSKKKDSFSDIKFDYCFIPFYRVDKAVKGVVKFSTNSIIYKQNHCEIIRDYNDRNVDDKILHFFGYETTKAINEVIHSRTADMSYNLNEKSKHEKDEFKNKIFNMKNDKNISKILREDVIVEASDEFLKKHPDYVECLQLLKEKCIKGEIDKDLLVSFGKLNKKYSRDVKKHIKMQDCIALNLGSYLPLLFGDFQEQDLDKASDELWSKKEIISSERSNMQVRKMVNEHRESFVSKEVPVELVCNGCLAAALINGMNREEALQFAQEKAFSWWNKKEAFYKVGQVKQNNR